MYIVKDLFLRSSFERMLRLRRGSEDGGVGADQAGVDGDQCGHAQNGRKGFANGKAGSRRQARPRNV